ncbi:hypothetical protein ACIBLA_22100 [Streptomyces sp. NPDC050433]|uniref:hypothetical protein n=1 Tax=unclassified Streptomyces TaxID=2593676 RepID=UPI003445E765
MRTIVTASAAVAGAAALVLGAAASVFAGDKAEAAASVFAGDKAEYDYSVSPEAVAPGGEVTIRTTGCQVPTVTVSSGVFETVTLNEGEEKSAKIFDDVKPEAEYEITFDCDGVIRSVPLMIKPGAPGKPGKPEKPGEPEKTEKPEKPGEPPHSAQPPGPWEPSRPEPPEQRPHEPREPREDGAHKGVNAGIGGSTDGGPNTAGLAAGAAVIAVAIGGGVRLVRDRSVNGSR